MVQRVLNKRLAFDSFTHSLKLASFRMDDTLLLFLFNSSSSWILLLCTPNQIIIPHLLTRSTCVEPNFPSICVLFMMMFIVAVYHVALPLYWL